MSKQRKAWDTVLAVVMILLCLLWVYPIVLILINSLKVEGTFTTSTVFQLPTKETFAGLSNYVYRVFKMNVLSSLGYSLLITVSSVVLILLCWLAFRSRLRLRVAVQQQQRRAFAAHQRMDVLAVGRGHAVGSEAGKK
mgnify:CR=1 FL=1